MIDRVIDWWTANIPPWALIALIVHGTIMLTVAYLILLERKVASWVQDRIGPNRVGLGFGIIPFIKNWKMNGLGQPLADGVKFIVKEDYRAAGVDKVLFTLAPGVMILVDHHQHRRPSLGRHPADPIASSPFPNPMTSALHR